MGDLSGSIERPGMERTIGSVTFLRSMAASQRVGVKAEDIEEHVHEVPIPSIRGV